MLGRKRAWRIKINQAEKVNRQDNIRSIISFVGLNALDMFGFVKY